MSLINNITWINQNMQIPSAIASDYIAREVVSKEISKIVSEEEESKVKAIKDVEEIEEILPDSDEKRKIESEAKKHIDIKA